MNPVIVIATHHRTEITIRNVNSLLGQSLVPKIILVCTTTEEYGLYQVKFFGRMNVYVSIFPNNPLGAKWQHGVDVAKHVFDNLSNLIIIGSDDIFGRDFVENICHLNTKFDFVGSRQWFIHDTQKGALYKMEYKRHDFPLGGGRCYSMRLLQKLNYQVFDVKRDRLLDDKGWYDSAATGLPYHIVDDCEAHGMNIVSVKGPWETMNSTDKILKASSCTVLQKWTGEAMNDKLKQLL